MSAAALYTIAIWSEKISRKLVLWMVLMIAAGFICDLIGTNAMRVLAKIHELNMHTIGGYAALVIMGLHLIWAILAIRKFKKPEQWFRRCSIYAWLLWLAVFISGIPKI